MTKKKVLVYTCVAGGYDRKLSHPPKFPWEMDLVAFTDSDVEPTRGWTIRPLHPDSLDLRPDLINRYHKILCHKVLGEQHQISVYIDGNVQMGTDFTDLIQGFIASERSIGLALHPQRSTLREELEACKRSGKFKGDDSLRADEQVSDYIRFGLPDNYPIYSATIIFRNHKYNFELADAMTAWWGEVTERTARDQLSLPYILWVADINPFILNFNIFDNPFFLRYSHGSSPPSRARILRRKIKHKILNKLFRSY